MSIPSGTLLQVCQSKSANIMAKPQFTVDQNKLTEWCAGRTIEALSEQFEEQGYLVFDQVLSVEQIETMRAELAPYLEQDISGRNNFEGVKSNRIYAMLNKSPKFAELITHPLALGFAEADLGRSCLLSACLAIQLKPGESVQPWHFDDAHLGIPRPRPSYGVSAFWAIDKTDQNNGATQIIPGSHSWPENSIVGSLADVDLQDKDVTTGVNDPGARGDAVTIPLEPGSLMLSKGTLWHRGGANNSDKPRLIITPQYCPGWCRQLENMLLAVAPENAQKLPQRAQELIGYNIHPPFMGYVNGMHPLRLLSD